MKRYVVFSGDRTYASGGAGDYVMDFTKKQEAISYRNSLVLTRSGVPRHDTWAHVWDTREHTIWPDVEEDEYGYSMGIG